MTNRDEECNRECCDMLCYVDTTSGAMLNSNSHYKPNLLSSAPSLTRSHVQIDGPT